MSRVRFATTLGESTERIGSDVVSLEEVAE
jgi:hypothetical protein